MSGEFLQGAADDADQRHVCGARLVRRYSEAVELVENVNDEAVAGESAAGKDKLGITHLESALVLHLENQDSLPVIKAGAVHAKLNTSDERTAALFCPRTCYLYVAALLKS